jgi:hypothetical protein
LLAGIDPRVVGEPEKIGGQRRRSRKISRCSGSKMKSGESEGDWGLGRGALVARIE